MSVLSSIPSVQQVRPKGVPCKVCGDEASGFHYGVDSCEGCKGFFRRCLTQGMNHKCAVSESCEITPFSRNSCQFCRLKKCFQVGMSREADHRQRTAVDDMNDEFKQRCVIGKAVAPVRKPPPIAPKPTILLNENSPPEEINQWLNSKGFSYKILLKVWWQMTEPVLSIDGRVLSFNRVVAVDRRSGAVRVQQVFATHNGRQLFQMSKATIERICGYDEGTRLYSQILVQKNRSGYKTIRSQELLGILQARRAKTEETEEDYLDTEYY